MKSRYCNLIFARLNYYFTPRSCWHHGLTCIQCFLHCHKAVCPKNSRMMPFIMNGILESVTLRFCSFTIINTSYLYQLQTLCFLKQRQWNLLSWQRKISLICNASYFWEKRNILWISPPYNIWDTWLVTMLWVLWELLIGFLWSMLNKQFFSMDQNVSSVLLHICRVWALLGIKFSF